MTQRDSLQKDREPRRFDVTLVGDTSLDLLMYGAVEELPCERELLASDMAIRPAQFTAHNLQLHSRLHLSARQRTHAGILR